MPVYVPDEFENGTPTPGVGATALNKMGAGIAGAGQRDVANEWTADQRFTSGRPHIDVDGFLDYTGATDCAAALLAKFNDAGTPQGAVFMFQPGRKYRFATTCIFPGTGSMPHLKGTGPRSYNEADSGVKGPLILADAGVTPFQFGSTAPSTVTYRGPVLENLTVREASDTKTAVAFDVRATVGATVTNCNFRGFRCGIRLDSYTYDASWWEAFDPWFYNCKRGIEAVGATGVIHGGNFSIQGEWGVYAEPKGSVNSAIRMFGPKFDIQGLGAVYSEGAYMTAYGAAIELTGGINNQVGFQFVRDAGKHSNSGKWNRVYGGGVTGTSGTGHTAVSVGTGCDRTMVHGLVPTSITTPITDLGSRTDYNFLGEAYVTNRESGETHWQMNNDANASLLRLVGSGATGIRWIVDQAGGNFEVELGGTTTGDEFIVQDSAGVDLFKVRGNSSIGFNNATPVTKPTVSGSRGGNAALASLLTALANYGLITDSSSA
jgi:hypothetical protein